MMDRKHRFLLAIAFGLSSIAYLNFAQTDRASARIASTPTESGVHWVHPVSSEAILRDFVSPNGDYSAGHRGIDFSSFEGETLLAVADGRIRFAGSVAGRGVISLDLADGLVAELEPACANVAKGDLVRQGQIIGTFCGASRTGDAGSAGLGAQTFGHCASACLHLSVRRFDPVLPRGFEYLSPRLFLGDFEPSRLTAVGALE